MPGVNKTDAEIAAAPYLMIPPRKYNTSMSPAMIKYYDTKRADMNYPSIRPVIVWRLAETYLNAAEALYKDGRPGEALNTSTRCGEERLTPTRTRSRWILQRRT